MKKGLFITFEGGEGAGKSTLIEGIFQQLSSDGHQVIKTREPGGTPLGEAIRKLLLQDQAPCPHAELALFLASRAEHVEELIQPALNAGKVVLCDRFNDSSIVYQGIARNLGRKQVAGVCDFFAQGLEPQLTFYLDIDPEVGLSRILKNRGKDRIEKEALSFHQKLREGYHLLQKQYPHRIHLLNASKPPEQVLEKALQCMAMYV